jgi:hypothetical protein
MKSTCIHPAISAVTACLALVLAESVEADLVITSLGKSLKPDPALTVVAQPRGDQRDRGSADRIIAERTGGTAS